MKWIVNVDEKIKEIELRRQPVIIRVNKFDEDSAEKFQQEIGLAHNTGQKVIPVVIDSYGGQVYSLMTMISAIRHSELPIATIVEGKAMSCGAVLLSFGEERCPRQQQSDNEQQRQFASFHKLPSLLNIFKSR